MVNGILDHSTEVCTFQLDDVKKILTNKETIVITSMILAMSDHHPRKSGLRIKVDGKIRTYTISIHAVKSNFRMFCSSKAWGKQTRKHVGGCVELQSKQPLLIFFACVLICIFEGKVINAPVSIRLQ